jgi:hypothetical protein
MLLLLLLPLCRQYPRFAIRGDCRFDAAWWDEPGAVDPGSNRNSLQRPSFFFFDRYGYISAN